MDERLLAHKRVAGERRVSYAVLQFIILTMT